MIVVGAGVAGLAAARRLRRAGKRVLVLEQADMVGGRVQTAMIAGCQYELGAEFLASFYTRTLALIAELGLNHELRPIPSRAAVFRAGRLHTLWPNPRVALTRLIRTRNKLSLSYLVGSLMRHNGLLDLQRFARAYPIDDTDVSTYAARHLSDELLEYVLQPALSGIFYWTPERTSRALLLIVLRAGLSRPTGLQLLTLRKGLNQLPQAMAHDLDVRQAVRVRAVERYSHGFLVRTSGGAAPTELRCAGVVVATTAAVVPQLCPWLDADRLEFFRAVRYSRTAQLTVGAANLPQSHYGLLFPRRETPFLASATLQGVKNPHSSPPGREAFCLHMSGPAANALHELDNDRLAALMLSELRRLLPAYYPGDPLFRQVSRWPEALPEFDVGHFARLQHFAEGAIELPGLTFAGDYVGGPFIEGAIVSGEQAAERLLQL
ncbi:MAG: FAD-dependent oxidoreductase [Oscillochloris sp.]|nr:FAD-dependent oxidoreductase [Oscillochloris sp.]